MSEVEQTDFTFAQLSEKAKQRVRERFIADTEFYDRDCIKDCDETLTYLGFSVDSREYQTVGKQKGLEPDVQYNVGWGHVCAVCNGRWYADRVDIGKLWEKHGPTDDLKKLAAEALSLYLRHPQMNFYIVGNSEGHPITIENISIDPDKEDIDTGPEWSEEYDALKDPIHQFVDAAMDWMAEQLDNEYWFQLDSDRADDYYTDDTAVRFDEDGNEL